MGFPLADWIDDHASCRYDLGRSGVAGSIQLPRLPGGGNFDRDAPILRRRLGRLSGVAADRVFLTHGATEGNTLALLYLARHSGVRAAKPRRCWIRPPEYPPIFDIARAVGFQPSFSPGPHYITALSRPTNPTGLLDEIASVRAWAEGSHAIVVDETFREFTDVPSLQVARIPRLWTVGSFTKAYGGDALRVGFVIPPADEEASFRRFHGLLLDELPAASVSGALALLRHRAALLAQSRELLRRNERALRESIEGVPRLAAPLWFDRGTKGLDGNRLARACLRASVLVCPGSFFADSSGVRICLTRKSFPRDLFAYLRVRERFLGLG
ncbi:MAG: pyridoxal phosphate-dependent aminotransferase [Thermoplasmata archaeon]